MCFWRGALADFILNEFLKGNQHPVTHEIHLDKNMCRALRDRGASFLADVVIYFMRRLHLYVTGGKKKKINHE